MGTWGSMSGLALSTPPSWLAHVECSPLPQAPAAIGAGFTLVDHGADWLWGESSGALNCTNLSLLRLPSSGCHSHALVSLFSMSPPLSLFFLLTPLPASPHSRHPQDPSQVLIFRILFCPEEEGI